MMSDEIWDELGKQRQETLELAKRVKTLAEMLAMVESILKEQGCPDWGEKENGILGPCGECAYCRVFVNPEAGK